MRKIFAIPALALLVVIAIGLVGTISGLVSAAIYKATGAAAAAAPLVRPAPGTAGGFRQHYEPLQNVQTIALIAEFERRFRTFSNTTTREPAGLYREPATVDLISDQPGWIKYQGYNSAASLGPPALAVGKLISDLVESSGPGVSWQVAPGARGGSARCAITTITDIRVSICAWATEHTAGALISPDGDTRGDELAVLLPLMRLDLQPG